MAVTLTEAVAALQALAPLEFAEPWDNVGLLLEPVAEATPISSALLTIDLSEEVLNEAQGLGAGLIVSYHPPLFRGFKRLRLSEPGERLVLRCVAQGMAVFSPHTALDAAPGGVNDWLLAAFGSGEGAPCLPHAANPRFGQGRCVRLEQPLTLSEATTLVKRHLRLTQLRVAASSAHAAGGKISSIAVCAGAGGSVFEKLPDYDLWLTGEMRHHDVRERVLRGGSVILSEHTHTERGFLPVFAERLARQLSGNLLLHVSQIDRDPLCLV